MRLQISSRLAVLALLDLASHPERQLSVVQIGEKYRVSSHHLAKVMHVLHRAGLVRAVRGAGGGYQLSGSARRTTLLDVIELFEGLSADETQTVASEPTPEARALRAVLDEIDDIVRATLGAITVATMVKLADRTRIERTGRAAAAR